MFQTTCVYNVILAFVYVSTHVSAEVLNNNESCAGLYERGVEAYLDDNFKGCVIYFEKAIEKHRLYTKTLQNCRIQCKQAASEKEPLYPNDIEDLQFFEKTVKNTLCILKCKSDHNDAFGLYNINKETEELFVNRKPYEYLHICYFQTKKYQNAASSAFTYLVSNPDDKVMLASLKHYSTFPEVDINDVINFEAKADILKIEVVKNSKLYNGTKRYTADNFLTVKQCKSLMYVGRLFGKLGDGYLNNKTPHTPMEIFGGITLTRAASLVSFGLMDIKYLKILLDATDRAKTHVQRHFSLTNLHFSYTHLVCRTAVPGSLANRTDFSHNVHADNCNLQPSGNCEKAYPSYITRDYSAIVYLNDDFIGGEFVFVSDYQGTIVESSIKPKCGRMVAFSSGVENLHAVKAVKKGTRCAVAVWFTLNSTQIEDRQYAYDMVEEER